MSSMKSQRNIAIVVGINGYQDGVPMPTMTVARQSFCAMKMWLLLLVTLLAIALVRFAFAQPASAQSCDKSYPTVCIPSPPPDLDCKDFKHCNFQVKQPDPHKFDRD